MLDKIIQKKEQEVKALKATKSLKPLTQNINAGKFYAALQNKRPAVIAEVKKGSPSKGIIRQDFDVKAIASSYQAAGAAALSVLTDQEFFYGAHQNIALAKSVSSLPVLRKDFIIDEIQLFESQHLHADAVLLIVAALEPALLFDLYQTAQELGLDILLECHDAKEVEIALKLEPVLLGINNRNLKTFETSLETTLTLKNMIPPSIKIVSESGLHSHQDIELMLDNDISSFLIGEAFMRQQNITEAFENIIGTSSR